MCSHNFVFFDSKTLTLEEIGLHPDDDEHDFFLTLYAQIPAEPGFCKEGTYQAPSSYVTQTNTGSQTPRYSVLKKLPAPHIKAFLSHTKDGTRMLSCVSNRELSVQNGLKEVDLLDALTMLFKGMPYYMYVNNDVNQYCHRLQHSCSMALKVLMKVYLTITLLFTSIPFLCHKPLRNTKGRSSTQSTFLMTNGCIFSSGSFRQTRAAYSTTRLTFPWRGRLLSTMSHKRQ
jgi:hypothetical protein